ncbi:MAG: NAD(P)-dependent alcohol dehydrogenase [Sandaracinus sp.]
MIASPSLMRAFVYERYGEPREVMHRVQVPLPDPGPGAIRVRVSASSINAADQRLARADPFLARLDNGLFRPRKRRILGADVCGVVDAIGEGITRWKVGDEVFGSSMAMGAFAEAMTLREDEVTRRPAGVSVHACAAAPLAGITAIQAVRERAKLRKGQRVLVMGAGGGVGTMVVQLAKAYGAHVTALCGAASVALVRSLGADEVVDHARGAEPKGSFDAVLGVNGYRSLATYLAWLERGGVYVMVGGNNRQIFEALLLGKLRFLGSGRRLEVLTIDERLRRQDLAELSALLADGRVKPVVERVVPFAEIPEAMSAAWGGHVGGKIVVEVG